LNRRSTFDLEQAILDPASTFMHPNEVLQAPVLSDALKIRILQSWRLDTHQRLTDTRQDTPDLEEFDTLQAINEALQILQSD